MSLLQTNIKFMNSQNFFKSIFPYACGMFSNLCFIFMQLFVKMIGGVMPTIQAIQIRSFLLLLINSYLIYINPKYSGNRTQIQQVQKLNVQLSQQKVSIKQFSINLKDNQTLKLILKRSIWSTISIVIYLNSLQYNTLSMCNSLFNIGPVMLFFIQAYMYKKPLQKIHFLLTLIAFCGVILMIKPFSSLNQKPNDKNMTNQIGQVSNLTYLTSNSYDYMDIFFKGLPILAAFTNSLAFIFLHQMKDSCHKLIALQYNYLITLFFHSFMLNFINLQAWHPVSDQPKYFQCSIFDIYFLSSIVLMVILAYGAHYFRVMALFMASPSKIVPLNYIGIITSLCIDIFWFKSQIEMLQIAGIFLTSTGLLTKLIMDISQGKN